MKSRATIVPLSCHYRAIIMTSGRKPKFGGYVRQKWEAREIGLREMAKKIGVSPTYSLWRRRSQI